MRARSPAHVVTVVHKPESTFEALREQLRRGA
jgi:hypothetical protein